MVFRRFGKKLRNHTLEFLILIVGLNISLAQNNTVGTILNGEGNTGYILFAPMNHKSTYLIDREGRLINSWSSDFVPGLTAFLDEEGNLYRAGRVTDATYLNAAGAGGIIERFDWDGNLTWRYQYADERVRQHHDFEVMPNGNVLLIAWEEISKDFAIQNGRDPESIRAERLWPDHLVEIRPSGFSDGEVVWQWHIMDHLVQDFDPSKPNFGVVSEHPELINFNHIDLPISDWIHSNSIEYNPSLDQIMISSRSFNEVWIIDHSTTTEEARLHEGGRANKGGDLLFRWGNPQAVQQGDTSDQKLFGQHGIHWFSDDRVLIFNNGHGRLEGNYASVEQIDLIRENDSYQLNDQKVFMIDSGSRTIFDAGDSLFAPLFSNVQGMGNDHLLLCLGPRGTFVEYDAQGAQVWKYISPVHENGTILNQGDDIGDMLSSNNSVFQVTYYPEDFPGFVNRDMSPGLPIEGPRVVSSTDDFIDPRFQIFPNPASDFISLAFKAKQIDPVHIFDQYGRRIRSVYSHTKIDVGDLEAGIYFLKVGTRRAQKLIIWR